MDIQADQAGSRFLRLTGVHSHPHPDVLTRRPWLGLQGPLDIHHRGDASTRRGEHGEERVALVIHLRAVVSRQTRPDELVMASQDLPVEIFAQTPQQSR